LATGKVDEDDSFSVSVLADGSGVVLEFETDEAYIIKIEEIVKEILANRT